MSGVHSDTLVHCVCALQHPALLSRRKVGGQTKHHRPGLVLWRHSGIWSAGECISEQYNEIMFLKYELNIHLQLMMS